MTRSPATSSATARVWSSWTAGGTSAATSTVSPTRPHRPGAARLGRRELLEEGHPGLQEAGPRGAAGRVVRRSASRRLPPRRLAVELRLGLPRLVAGRRRRDAGGDRLDRLHELVEL